ncbi:MAG: hypothetical protein GY878_03385 [Fuerstiella sp.]|jgi:hypothetical protein|nr:hypothetical protein [Fuerstiella sp.]
MSEPYRAPEQELADEMPDLVAKKRRILIWLLAYMGILGLVGGFQGEVTDPLINVAMWVPLLILSIMWCYTDADERDYEMGLLTKVLLIFLLVVGLPLYLLQTRRAGVLRSLAWLFLYVLALLAAAMVGALPGVFLST